MASLPCRRLGGRWRCPLGGLPGRSPADVAVPKSVGVACLLCCLPTLPLVCFFAPHPPNPLPGGKGENFSFLMQGAAPLASPGELNPGGIGAGGEPRARREVAIPVACRPCRSGIRRGGLPSLSPARPAFSFISFPYPPDPLPPWGRGRILVFLCKGRSPLHKKTKNLPLPRRGRGSGGWGQNQKLK